MGLEAATFVSDLNTSNPASGDARAQGDDHLRLLKAALKATFPNASKAFYFPDAAAKTADFTVASTDLNKTFYVTTAGGNVTATLPTLASGDAGWECHFIKTNTDLNPLFIQPASGTLSSGEVSGLSKCRRCIPGHKCTATWTGVAWFVSRVPRDPVGSCIEFHGASLPVGYEWPNGQTLSSASTNYPEYNSVKGSGATLDRKERVAAMRDVDANVSRLTNASGGVDGNTLGATGGADTHTLVLGESPAHDHGGSVASSGAHTHTYTDPGPSTIAAGGSPGARNAPVAGTATSSDGAHTHTITSAGGGNAHNNVQPTIITNFILVVE